MKAVELRKGNLILTSKDAGGLRFLRSIVKEVLLDSVIVMGDRKVMLDDCEGIELTDAWLDAYGLDKKDRGVKFVHELQNLYSDSTGKELQLKSSVK